MSPKGYLGNLFTSMGIYMYTSAKVPRNGTENPSLKCTGASRHLTARQQAFSIFQTKMCKKIIKKNYKNTCTQINCETKVSKELPTVERKNKNLLKT